MYNYFNAIVLLGAFVDLNGVRCKVRNQNNPKLVSFYFRLTKMKKKNQVVTKTKEGRRRM